MTRYTISEDETFSRAPVTSAIFGTNFVTSYDFDVAIDSDLLSLLDQMNVSILRFPGGSVTESIFADSVFSTGNWNTNIHVDRDGSLTTITPFSNFAGVAGAVDAEIQIVMPTRVAFAQSAGQALSDGTYGRRTELATDYLSDVRRFVDFAIEEAARNGTSVSTLEIGNEFWGSGQMTAFEYGHLAGQLATYLDAIYPGLDIIVQAAASANEYSPAVDLNVLLEPDGHGDFVIHRATDIRGPYPEDWIAATIPGSGNAASQTQTIAEQISAWPGAGAVVDGVVGHVYFDGGFDGIDTQRDFALSRVPDLFAVALGRDNLDFHVTEWSARNPLGTSIESNGGNANGLHFSHTTIEAFFELVSNGVDSANFWPTTFGSAASDNRVLIDTNDEDLSFGGVTFQWLSESTVGMEAIFDFEIQNRIDIHGFGAEGDLTIFVSERSGGYQSAAFGNQAVINLGEFAPDDGATVVITRMYSDDGSITDDTANPLQTYETDILSGGGRLELDLLPWEVVRVEIQSIDSVLDPIERGPRTVEPTATIEGQEIKGTADADVLFGSGGDDSLVGEGGDDVLHGGEGNDRIVGAQGNDTAHGGLGDDVLVGDFGNEVLYGDEGNDTLRSWAGTDYLDGGTGNDLFILSATAGTGEGLVAVNMGNSRQVGTGTTVTLNDHGMFSAFVDGGAGQDTLQLSDRSEAFALHNGITDIHSEASAALIEEGIDPSLRFRGIERIEARGGDDIIDLTSDVHYLAATQITVDGGAGDDTIWGSHIDEIILGGAGDDVLFGGAGNDILHGGEGADVFEFTRTSTETTVIDFDPTEGDVLRFHDRGGAAFDLNSITFSNTGLLIGYRDAVEEMTEHLFIDLALDPQQMSDELLNNYAAAIEII